MWTLITERFRALMADAGDNVDRTAIVRADRAAAAAEDGKALYCNGLQQPLRDRLEHRVSAVAAVELHEHVRNVVLNGQSAEHERLVVGERDTDGSAPRSSRMPERQARDELDAAPRGRSDAEATSGSLETLAHAGQPVPKRILGTAEPSSRTRSSTPSPLRRHSTVIVLG